MNRSYPTRINWENEPSQNTPLNEDNLNLMDYAIFTIDGRVVDMDTTKANQSDLLQSISQLDYNTTTGVMTFTWHNGTTKTIDLNIEKIPVTFSMDEHGVITMTTADGTQYTADVGALIKNYTFNDSSVIDFTVTTDGTGNKVVTADIIDGSITGSKLQPNYLADAQDARSGAITNALKSEGYSVGEQNGSPVGPDSPYYHNNAKYFSDQAGSQVFQQSNWNETDTTQSAYIQNKPFIALDNDTIKVDANGVLYAEVGTTIEELNDIGDVNIDNPSDGQVLTYDNGKWVNADASGGLLPELNIYSDSGSTVTVTNGTVTLTPSEIFGTGHWICEVPSFGSWTITSVYGGETATVSVNVDAVKVYSVNVSHFEATISVTAPSGSVVTVQNGMESYEKSIAPYEFTVHSSGTWTVTCQLGDAVKTLSVVITSAGETQTATFTFATLTVTYGDTFYNQSISVTDGTRSYTKVATSSGSVSFPIANHGTWTISSTVSGTTYTAQVEISTDTTYTVELASFGYKGWLESASIPDTFGSLNAVLQSETTLRTLFTKHASVDYLVEWLSNDADTADTILNTDLVAKWVNLRDYALDSLWAVASIKAVMDTADKYGYGEWVLKDDVWQPKGNVPIMTSDSAPYGSASASSVYGSGNAFHAFDGNTALKWVSNSGSATQTLAYTFKNPICVKKYSILSDGSDYITAWKLQGYDGTNWEDIDTRTSSSVTENQMFSINNDNYYLGYRLYITASARGISALGCAVNELQFYGRELKVSVPTMTSNTAPWGEVSCTRPYSGSGYEPWKAFDGNISTGWSSASASDASLVYHFIQPILPRAFKIEKMQSAGSASSPYGFKIQGSNDGSVWIDLTTEYSGSASLAFNGSIDTNNSYEYIRVQQTSGTSGIYIFEMNFYGLDYSEHTERHWIYDHGVEVEEVTSDGYLNNDDKVSRPCVKNSEYVEVTALNTEVGMIGTKNGIDLSNYTLLRGIIGSTTNYANMQIGVCLNKKWDSLSYSSLTDIKANGDFTEYNKFSSLQQVAYPCVRCYGQNDTQNLRIVEMWLE